MAICLLDDSPRRFQKPLLYLIYTFLACFHVHLVQKTMRAFLSNECSMLLFMSSSKVPISNFVALDVIALDDYEITFFQPIFFFLTSLE
jgi:hypothetical protein